ncbi:MAG: response regulator [Patescibacteria group bacterium]
MEPQKKKILLIDDNEIVRLMFSNVFWLHGLDDDYELVAITRIEEAESILSNPVTRPDIIFTGLVMPFTKDGKTETSAEAGFTLLKRIKDDPSTKSIRVIIFSSFDEAWYRDQVMALGAEMYLKKSESMPQDIIDLLRSLNTK